MTAFHPDDPCLVPRRGEVLVTYDGEQPFPALVDPGEPLWNGFLSPGFRPDVVIQLAHYVAEQNTQSNDPEVQDWLVVAPDQRSVALLVADFDGERWRPVLELVYPLYDPGDLAQRSAIGAWRWTWTTWDEEYPIPHDDRDDD